MNKILLTFAVFLLPFFTFAQAKKVKSKPNYVYKFTVSDTDSLPSIYIINAVRQLSEKEVDSIKQCVAKNEKSFGSPSEYCGEKGVFYISIEI